MGRRDIPAPHFTNTMAHKDAYNSPGPDAEVEFKVDNFQPPSGVQPGDEFNAVATLRLEADGETLCLKDIEGHIVRMLTKKENKTEDEAEGPQGSSDQPPSSFLAAVEAGAG